MLFVVLPSNINGQHLTAFPPVHSTSLKKKVCYFCTLHFYISKVFPENLNFPQVCFMMIQNIIMMIIYWNIFHLRHVTSTFDLLKVNKSNGNWYFCIQIWDFFFLKLKLFRRVTQLTRLEHVQFLSYLFILQYSHLKCSTLLPLEMDKTVCSLLFIGQVLDVRHCGE